MVVKVLVDVVVCTSVVSFNAGDVVPVVAFGVFGVDLRIASIVVTTVVSSCVSGVILVSIESKGSFGEAVYILDILTENTMINFKLPSAIISRFSLIMASIRRGASIK